MQLWSNIDKLYINWNTQYHLTLEEPGTLSLMETKNALGLMGYVYA